MPTGTPWSGPVTGVSAAHRAASRHPRGRPSRRRSAAVDGVDALQAGVDGLERRGVAAAVEFDELRGVGEGEIGHVADMLRSRHAFRGGERRPAARAAGGRRRDILLLCGLGDDQTAWDAQTAEFAATRRVTVIDNRGVGQSTLPDGEFTVADLAADAAAVCDALGIGTGARDRVLDGGAMAQELVLSRPGPGAIAGRSWALVHVGSTLPGARQGAAYTAGIADDARVLAVLLPRLVYSAAVHEDGRIDTFVEAALANPHPQETEAFQRTARALLHHDTADRLPPSRADAGRGRRGRRAVPAAPLPRDRGRASPDRAWSRCRSRRTSRSRRTRPVQRARPRLPEDDLSDERRAHRDGRGGARRRGRGGARWSTRAAPAEPRRRPRRRQARPARRRPGDGGGLAGRAAGAPAAAGGRGR